MLPNTTLKLRHMAVLLFAAFFCGSPGQARPHVYSSTLIHKFEPDQWPWGILVGKPGKDLFGVAASADFDNTPAHIYKISTTDEFTYFDPMLNGERSYVPRQNKWGWDAMNGLLQTKDGSFYGVVNQPFWKYDTVAKKEVIPWSAIYKTDSSGSGAIIFKFPGTYTQSQALHEGPDKCLYGITDEWDIFPNMSDCTLYRINPGGGGFKILQKIRLSETGGGGTPYQCGPVAASDGNMYVIMPPENLLDTPWLERITPNGDVIKVARAPEYQAFTSTSDGVLYGIIRNTVIRVSTEGVISIVHTFTENEGTPGMLAPFVAGQHGTLYGECCHKNSEGGTIFTVSADGKYEVVGILDDPGISGGLSWLTPSPHHIFYSLVDHILYKLTVADKHISLNFTGTAVGTVAGDSERIKTPKQPAETGTAAAPAQPNSPSAPEPATPMADAPTPPIGPETPQAAAASDTSQKATVTKAKTPSILKPTYELGVSPADHWINLSGAEGTSTVTDDFGEDGPTITWSAEKASLVKVADDTPDCQMMRGCLETKGKKDITIEVSGIPADFIHTTYDVYVYCSGGKDELTSRGTYTIGDRAVITSGTQTGLFDSAYVRAEDKKTGNCVLFPHLKDESFILTVTHDDADDKTGHAVVNGIQIVQHVEKHNGN